MQFRPRTVLQILAISFITVLAGCSTTPLSTPSSKSPSASSASRSSTTPVLPPAGSGRGGYYKDDGPGDDIPEGLENLPDAEPRVEPYANRGNKPYVVFGKNIPRSMTNCRSSSADVAAGMARNSMDKKPHPGNLTTCTR